MVNINLKVNLPPKEDPSKKPKKTVVINWGWWTWWAQKMEDLTDVEINNIQDWEVLSWDASSWKFVNSSTWVWDMQKNVYDTNNNWIVDKAEEIDDWNWNTASAVDIVDAINQKHEHSNKTLLDSLTDSWNWNKFLSDNWTYKELSDEKVAITSWWEPKYLDELMYEWDFDIDFLSEKVKLTRRELDIRWNYKESQEDVIIPDNVNAVVFGPEYIVNHTITVWQNSVFRII